MIVKEQQWRMIFQVMSWIYSISWSCTFYGQIFQNFKLKSVEGMNLNYAFLNINGFFLYSWYNLHGYFVSQQETGKVDEADIFFAIHAFAATAFMILQTCIYFKGQNTLSNWTKLFLLWQWLFIAFYYIEIKFGIILKSTNVSYISMMGNFKLISTALKYMPQLYWNYYRKTTYGWSIISILLDLNGGIFSSAQITLQTRILGQSLNLTKLLLGILTIIFDLLFIYQHFCLYSSANTGDRFHLQVQQTTPDMSNGSTDDNL